LPKLTVSGVGGVTTSTVGKGTVFLHSKCNGIIHTLQLQNMLHVPKNTNSLLSLGCWEQQQGCSIVIKHRKLSLLTKDDIPVACSTRLSNRLYQMSFVLAHTLHDTDFAFHVVTRLPSWANWHRCFGHVSYSGLQRLYDKLLVDGFVVNLSTKKPNCIACTKAKMTVMPYGPSAKRYTKVGELTHIDLWGKYNKASIHGNYYYLLLVDDASWYTTVAFLKEKNQATQHIKDYMMHLIACGHSPCTICMDRGTEFVNEALRTWCHPKGIRYQMTAPHSPSQNGVAEWMNCTLGELSCTMLVASGLPEFLWEAATKHAAYIWNLSFMKFIPNSTPYQLWTGCKPNIAHL